MKTYIAVNEIHDRPNLEEPTRVTKVGKPITLSDADAKSLGNAVREPTDDEIKMFGIGEAVAEKPVKKPAAKKPAAEKPAAEDAKAGDDGANLV